MAQAKKNRNYIEKIKKSNGDLTYSTKDIAATFKNYYEELYNINQTGGQEGEKEAKIRDFLAKARLPKIDDFENSYMDRPITEVKMALKNTAAGKSPGPDGFTVFYYKKFSNILVPRLYKYFNGVTYLAVEPDVHGVAALAPLIPRPLIEQTGGTGVQSRTNAGCSAGAGLEGLLEAPVLREGTGIVTIPIVPGRRRGVAVLQVA